jgi:hypothetical protein
MISVFHLLYGCAPHTERVLPQLLLERRKFCNPWPLFRLFEARSRPQDHRIEQWRQWKILGRLIFADAERLEGVSARRAELVTPQDAAGDMCGGLAALGMQKRSS